MSKTYFAGGIDGGEIPNPLPKNSRVYSIGCNDYGLVMSDEILAAGCYGRDVFMSDDGVCFHSNDDLQPAYPGMYIGERVFVGDISMILNKQLWLGRYEFRVTTHKKDEDPNNAVPPVVFHSGGESYKLRGHLRGNLWEYDHVIKVDPAYRAEIERQCRVMDETSRVQVFVQGEYKGLV